MVGAKGWQNGFFGPDGSYDMQGAREAERNDAFRGGGHGSDDTKLKYDAATVEECMERCLNVKFSGYQCNSFTFDPDHRPVLINKNQVRNNLPNCLLAVKQQSNGLLKLQKEENYEHYEGYWWYTKPEDLISPNMISGIRCSFDNLIDPPRPADYVYTKGKLKIIIQ